MDFKETVGASLKRFRKEFNLNQRVVAAKIGIPYQSYQTYEYGKSVPSAEVIFNLANAYNVSADYLLGRSDEPRPTNFDEKEVKEAFAIRDLWRQLQSISSTGQSAGQVPAQ